MYVKYYIIGIFIGISTCFYQRLNYLCMYFTNESSPLFNSISNYFERYMQAKIMHISFSIKDYK